MSDFNPTAVEIVKAELISFDQQTVRNISSNYIYGFEITQSMDAVAYSGSISLLDSSGILEGMPIRGEEQLILWLMGMDFQTEVKIAAVVHKVTDIKPSSNSGSLTYKLHFISEDSFVASTKMVTTSFTKAPHEMAYEIFKNNYSPLKPLEDSFYKDPDDENINLPYQAIRYPLVKDGEKTGRNVVIQNTSNRTKLIIPRLNSSEAMFFVAARGYSPDTPSQTFRFFETLENYYFCTDEYFIRRANNVKDRILDLFYAPVVNLDGKNAQAQLERIETLDIISKGIDTSTDLFSGAYTSEVVEIDLVKRQLDYSYFNYDNAAYIDMSGTTRSLQDNPHTESFRASAFNQNNARRFMVFKNYTSKGDSPSNILPDQHLPEIVHNRVSYYHHLNNTVLLAKMKGRLDIRPGMIANVDIKSLNSVDSNIQSNDSLSGRYLVQQTTHSMAEGTLNTTLKLAKFDWSGTTQLSTTSTADIPNATQGPR